MMKRMVRLFLIGTFNNKYIIIFYSNNLLLIIALIRVFLASDKFSIVSIGEFLINFIRLSWIFRELSLLFLRDGVDSISIEHANPIDILYDWVESMNSTL